MSFTIENGHDTSPHIMVLGVGGGGGNAVNNMVTNDVKGIEFVAVNTDAQALYRSAAAIKMQIGEKVTHGLGAGSNPEVGKKSALENEDEIRKILEPADMIFITAGMGGGTGTGAAPIVAQIARDMGILTVAVVTRPFKFEGKRRSEQAEIGIAELKEQVDAIVVVPNERLKLVSDQRITMKNAFEVADNVLKQAVQSIAELMTEDGYINLDFADVSTIMRNAGFAHMGVGRASGKDKAAQAASMAIQSPLLETSIDGAHGIILNITGSPDIGMEDVDIASTMVQEAAHPDAHIIFGVAIDDNLDDEIRVTVVATGFDKKPGAAAPSMPRAEAPAAAPAARFWEAVPQAQTQTQTEAPAAEEGIPAKGGDSDMDELMKTLEDVFKKRGETTDRRRF